MWEWRSASFPLCVQGPLRCNSLAQHCLVSVALLDFVGIQSSLDLRAVLLCFHPGGVWREGLCSINLAIWFYTCEHPANQEKEVTTAIFTSPSKSFCLLVLALVQHASVLLSPHFQLTPECSLCPERRLVSSIAFSACNVYKTTSKSQQPLPQKPCGGDDIINWLGSTNRKELLVGSTLKGDLHFKSLWAKTANAVGQTDMCWFRFSF